MNCNCLTDEDQNLVLLVEESGDMFATVLESTLKQATLTSFNTDVHSVF